MKRITVFTGNKKDYHQAVIVESSLSAFLDLGFVTSVDLLKDSESGSEKEKTLRAEIKKLGGKPAGRSSIETLEKQLLELQDADSKQD